MKRDLKIIDGGILSNHRSFESADLMLCALGYETRVTYVAEYLIERIEIKRKTAISFETPQVLKFDENQSRLFSHGFSFVPFVRDESDFLATITQTLASAIAPNQRTLNVCVDISCMSRKMLALLIEALVSFNSEIKIVVEFLYAAAIYQEQPADDSPTTISEPVTAFFAGWAENPNLAASMIMGLGFEYGRAIGTIEDLQPSHLSIFAPQGEDKRFDEKVRRLNDGVLTDAGPSITTYNVLDPLEQISLLYSALRGYATYSRPVLVPLGPKVFALSCLVAALAFPNDACVWRVSPDDSALPIDQIPSGTIVSLRIELTT